MKTVIFLNRWNDLYHLMLASVSEDGENSRRLVGNNTPSQQIVCRDALGSGQALYHTPTS